jgi:hypothetical protein
MYNFYQYKTNKIPSNKWTKNDIINDLLGKNNIKKINYEISKYVI